MEKKRTPMENFVEKYGSRLVDKEGRRLVAVGSPEDKDTLVVADHQVPKMAVGLMVDDVTKLLEEIEVDCVMPGCGELVRSKKEKKGKKTGNAVDAFVVSGFDHIACSTHREGVAAWWSFRKGLKWHDESAPSRLRRKKGLMGRVAPLLCQDLYRKNRIVEVEELIQSVRRGDEGIRVFDRAGLVKAFKAVKISHPTLADGNPDFDNLQFDVEHLEAVAEGLAADGMPLSCKPQRNGLYEDEDDAQERRVYSFYNCVEIDILVQYDDEDEPVEETAFILLASPNANVARYVKGVKSRDLARSVVYHRTGEKEEAMFAKLAESGGKTRDQLVNEIFGHFLEVARDHEDNHFVDRGKLDHQWLAKECSRLGLIEGNVQFSEQELKELPDDVLSLVNIFRGGEFFYVIMLREMAYKFCAYLTDVLGQWHWEVQTLKDGSTKKRRGKVRPFRLTKALPWLKSIDEEDRKRDMVADQVQTSLDDKFAHLFENGGAISVPDGEVSDPGRVEQRGGRESKPKKSKEERQREHLDAIADAFSGLDEANGS